MLGQIHTHTHSLRPTTTGSRWKLPGLGKAPNLQLHLCHHPEAAEPADHHLSLQSQTSHTGLVQAASAQSPTSLMQDSASTGRAQPAHLCSWSLSQFLHPQPNLSELSFGCSMWKHILPHLLPPVVTKHLSRREAEVAAQLQHGASPRGSTNAFHNLRREEELHAGRPLSKLSSS